MKNGRSKIDQVRIFDFRPCLQSRRAGDEDTVKAMRAAPFGSLRWLVFPNNKGRLIGILGEARLSGEQAVLAPPIEHEISAFIGEWSVENFVAPVDPVDNWLAITRIFQLGQFRDDEVNQSLVIGRIDSALGLYAFEVDPNAGRRSEHFAAVGFGPAPIDAGERRVSHLALLHEFWERAWRAGSSAVK